MSEGRKQPRQRGVFERPKGSGIWWVVYFDEHGRRHREKVGSKGLANDVYRKRKNEVRERRFFPETIRRREVLLKDWIVAFQRDHVQGRLRNAKKYASYGKLWAGLLGTRSLRQVVPSDIAKLVTRWQEGGRRQPRSTASWRT